MTLTLEQTRKLSRIMKGNKNSKGSRLSRWRIGITDGSSRREALVNAGIKTEWGHSGYIGITTGGDEPAEDADRRAAEWIDKVEKLGYRVRYFRRPKEDE